MIKKLVISFSGIMFVMLFAVMVSLISIALYATEPNQKVLATKQHITTNQLTVNNEDKKNYNNPNNKTLNNNLNIKTDKSIYTTNEKIIISFENSGENAMTQNQKSNLTVKLRPDLGKNFQVAFIEKFIGDDWVVIEPVKRCSKKCNEPCSDNELLQPKKIEIFTWAQNMVNCKENGEALSSRVTPGSYRVVSASWNSIIDNFEKIYSNEFKISGLTKK